MRALAVVALALTLLATVPAAQSPRPSSQPASPARPPAREMAMPFRVGETLTYDVAWSTYLIAGTATTTVVEKKPSYSSNAYYIVAEGRPLPLIARLYALYYKMDTLLDSFTGQSQRTSLYVEEGSNRRTSTTMFDRAKRRALFEFKAQETARDEFAIPADVQDGLATLYSLRTRTFKAGDRVTIPVADEGTLYSVRVEAAGPEHVKMRIGEFEAMNLRLTILDAEGKQVGKNVAVLLSTDARRLPLRLQAELPVGYFALALKEIR
jgi:hypothetical protein